MATHSPPVWYNTATPYGRYRLPNTQIKNCSTGNKGYSIPPPMKAHVKGKFIVDRFCFKDFLFTEFLQNLIVPVNKSW